MNYVLDARYRLRGWHGAQTGVYDTQRHEAHFVAPQFYKLIMKCDARQDIDLDSLPGKELKIFEKLLAEKVVRPAGHWDFLLPEQRYHAYPARYRNSVHWSITGACNLRCRHCFMSAPHAKHGAPSREEIMNIADQLAECGVFSASLTGGEPLIREDFLEIIDALIAREIAVTTIYTNGWLVDEKLLDALEARGVRPSFQLSFDGIGLHDFLRGVHGAEERTVSALRLLQARGYSVEVSMCIHRKNAPVLRETVNYLASLGVKGMKCGSMMELGEWADPALNDLKLTKEEELELFESYIPQYFQDDAPLSIMLSGAFLYEKGSPNWGVFYHRECPKDQEDQFLSCPVLGKAFYIGADGMVAPCQGMCDCGFAKTLPSLKDRPLREILTDSPYVKLSYTTVGDVRRGNEECRKCEYIDRCTGSCRNAALIACENYYGVDPDACFYFKNGWEARIRAAAQPAFEEYIKRNPP
ncbi:MAG: radical SAM protein, partial [Clostridia bacterium]|nr:radical SAM protein [Clostridia bacterium]